MAVFPSQVHPNQSPLSMMMIKNRVMVIDNRNKLYLSKILCAKNMVFYKPLYESKSREIQVKNCVENSCFEISYTGEVPRIDLDLEELT